MAETDRNRTCQTEMLGLTGFEDRGAHQDTYASVCSPYTGIPRYRDTYQPLHSPRCATVATAPPEEIPLLRTTPRLYAARGSHGTSKIAV